MPKRGKLKMLLSGLMLAGVVIGPAVAQSPSDDGYLYEYRYFSDASSSEQVGYAIDGCNDPGYLEGERTQYYSRNIIGYREGAQCIYI